MMQERARKSAEILNGTRTRHDRVTATETIAGTPCRITLEQDEKGQYREVLLTPLDEKICAAT